MQILDHLLQSLVLAVETCESLLDLVSLPSVVAHRFLHEELLSLECGKLSILRHHIPYDSVHAILILYHFFVLSLWPYAVRV